MDLFSNTPDMLINLLDLYSNFSVLYGYCLGLCSI
jgi:hypothetical protein